jgi:hypothetical protein
MDAKNIAIAVVIAVLAVGVGIAIRGYTDENAWTNGN